MYFLGLHFEKFVAAELRLGDFNVQNLANAAWAFATASQQDAKVFVAFARVAAELRLGDFNVQGLANTAWAFTTSRQQGAQVFAALVRAAELRLGDFNVQDLANTAGAFATARQQDVQRCKSELETAIVANFM